MDKELEDWLLTNDTDDYVDLDIKPREVVHSIILIVFTVIGLISNIIIIYMIVRNTRMRSKTNLLLMNFIINDSLFLACNIHIWSAIHIIFGNRLLWWAEYSCLIDYTDIGLQTNESVFLLMLVSSTLNKNKRIQLKWLLIIIYPLLVVSFFLNQIFCQMNISSVIVILGMTIIVSNFALVLSKEFKNCYKKWYKKESINERSMFRLNIGRIYVACWLAVFIAYLSRRVSFFDNYFFYILAQHCTMCGFYILIYIVSSDKNFKICFLNLLRGNFSDDYDVDTTITFGEELGDDGHDTNVTNRS